MNKMIWEWTGKEAKLDEILKLVGKGWTPLLTRLLEDLFKLGWDGKLYQVKEKFAHLRVYISDNHDNEPYKMFDRIDEAALESLRTCEFCGAPGESRNQLSWRKTLCNKCLKEHKNE